MKRVFSALLLAGALACPVEAALVWRPGEGWVNESSGETLAASDAKAALQMSRDFESKEAWKDALAGYRTIIRRWPLSSAAGEAQFKAGLMQEKMGDFWNANKSYQEVVKKYAGSQYFDLAIERQYNIGNLFLAGEPQRIWKIPLFPSMEKTIQIFQGVIKNAPYGKYAPASQFKIGLANEQQKKWTAAIDAYNKLLDRYPKSDYADDAQYQIGYAWYQASSQPEYDQSAAQKSIEAFQDFSVRFPNSEKAAQAREYVQELSERRIKGSINIARFYEQQKNYKAAIIYYGEVVQQNPDSPDATEAKQKMEALRSKVEKASRPGQAPSEADVPPPIDSKQPPIEDAPPL
ncbi:MAG: outer membrane protein assembly factor BamD [Candidatus Methylacidiphilales bacterium]|nr:outer membrane protein assembly factor BamD [Candidatus Methylacidiphilales bacterium]